MVVFVGDCASMCATWVPLGAGGSVMALTSGAGADSELHTAVSRVTHGCNSDTLRTLMRNKPGKKKSPRTVKRSLPAALVKRARAAALAKKQRDRARAEDLLALVLRRKQRISEDFYDIGLALKELQKHELYEALGCKTFDELLATRVELSFSLANALIKTVEQVPRKLAIDLGQSKTAALVELAAATPEDDTAASLAISKLRIRGAHEPVDLAEASVRKLREVAKAVRREHAPKGTALHEAEGVARAIQRGLEQAGVVGAEARAVRKRRKGQAEIFELSLRLPIGARSTLARVLRRT